MPPPFDPCPYLPPPPETMDAGVFAVHGPARDDAFYLTALTYGHYLWQGGQPARAILKLDRAFGADLRGDEPILLEWPLPYQAMSWILMHTPATAFTGNPRVHFQHLADRMNEPRREQRRWRMWACWSLCRLALPHLPGDSRHIVIEPSFEQITEKLMTHGISGETALWRRVMDEMRRATGAIA